MWKNVTIRPKPGFPLSYWAVPVRMRGLDRMVAMRGHHHPYDQPVFWTRNIYDCLGLRLDHLSSICILLSIPPSCVCLTFGFVCWFATTTSATFICDTSGGAGLPLLRALGIPIAPSLSLLLSCFSEKPAWTGCFG